MGLKLVIKRYVSQAFYYMGVVRFLRSIHKNENVIVAYHRVLPEDFKELRYIQPGMYVTCSTFEKHMAYISAHYTVLNFSEVRSFDEIRGACFVTFDDGWSDTYEYAYPILMKYNIPATIFVCTNLIGSQTRLWSDKIGAYIHQASEEELGSVLEIMRRHCCREFDKYRGDRILLLESICGAMKKMDDRAASMVISAIEASMGGESEERSSGGVWLSWKEIEEMRSSGQCFGSHSHNHKILSQMGYDDMVREIETSQEILASKLGKKPDLMSYPNGDYNPDIIGVLRKLGFRLGFSTKSGFVSESENEYALCRLMIHDDIARFEEMFACKLVRCLV